MSEGIDTPQARQRLTGSTLAGAVPRGASTANPNLSSRPLNLNHRSTEIPWSPGDEPLSGTFVVDMSNLGYSQHQSQLSASEIESNPVSMPNAAQTDSGSAPGNSSQSRTRPGHQDANTEEELGFTGQASSIWNQTVNQNPELSGMMKAFEKYIPFIIIVTFKNLVEHSTGIFVFLGMMITFYHANSVVCREVSRQQRRSSWPLVAVLVNLSACIAFIYYVFREDELYLCAIFLSIGKVTSLYDLIWYVGINDFILKYFAVIIKILIVLLPSEVLPHRRRGNFFLFVESTSQVHRTLAPIPIWLHYLLESLHTDSVRIPAKVLGVILTAAYMVLKGRHILKVAICWKNATTRLMTSTSYGRCPSKQEMKSTGNTCPICHDNFQDPTMLHCKHIFCEECVSTWFDRERTCPMCRAQITDDPIWRDGTTSQFIQLF